MAELWLIPAPLKQIHVLRNEMENSPVFRYKAKKLREAKAKLNLLPFSLYLLSLKQKRK